MEIRDGILGLVRFVGVPKGKPGYCQIELDLRIVMKEGKTRFKLSGVL